MLHFVAQYVNEEQIQHVGWTYQGCLCLDRVLLVKQNIYLAIVCEVHKVVEPFVLVDGLYKICA